MACSASSSLAGCTGSAERSAACCNRHDRACLALRIFATNRRLLSASLGLLLLPPGRKTILPQEDVQGKIRHAADLEKSSDCERYLKLACLTVAETSSNDHTRMNGTARTDGSSQ